MSTDAANLVVEIFKSNMMLMIQEHYMLQARLIPEIEATNILFHHIAPVSIKIGESYQHNSPRCPTMINRNPPAAL